MGATDRRYWLEDLSKREAELAACLDGTFPRDMDDLHRYNAPDQYRDQYQSGLANQAMLREYVADICRKEIAWLKAKLETSK